MATDWYLVSTASSNDSALFVDRDSIKSSGTDMQSARILLVFRVDNSSGVAAYDEDLEYDCGRPQYRFLNIKSFSAGGTKLTDELGTGKWRPIVAGSLDEGSKQFVCGGGSRSGAVKYGTAFPLSAGRAKLNGGGSSNSGSSTYKGHGN